jgi:hypothetical protein
MIAFSPGRRAALLSLLLCVAGGAAQPDFSGTWQINFDKSDFGNGAKPYSWTRTIKQSGNQLEIASSQPRDAGSWTVAVSIGGGEGRLRGDSTGTMKAYWEGAKLVVISEIQSEHGAVKKTDRWELSSDGKSMVATGRVETPHGSFDMRLVWDRK